MKEKFTNKRGAIALLTVIAVTSIVLSVGLVVIAYSIDTSRISASNSDLEIAMINANTCLEESLYKIKLNPNYTVAAPGVSLTLQTNNSCTFVVTNGVAPNKIVTVTGVYLNNNYQHTFKVDTSANPFTISNN